MNKITLNNGITIPKIGFGVFQIPKEDTENIVYEAIKVGYRLIDTAIIYGNEVETGLGIKRAIQEGIVKREELFITTKLFFKDIDEEVATKAIKESLERLNLDYIDLFLIHQPYGDVYGAWRALDKTYKDGILKSIGVSNFSSAKLIEFVNLNKLTIPQVNQIEVNPFHQRLDDIKYHEKYDVKIEAWAPFAEGRNNIFSNEVLEKIGKKYNKSVGQVILRWLIQRDIIVLAKTVRVERMIENISVFDFELSKEDMETIEKLDKKESAFFNHEDPKTVEWFMQRIGGR